MAYIPPARLMKKIKGLSQEKADMSIGGMLLKGFLADAILAYAAAFAFKASDGFSAGAATLVAALGFAMIAFLGQELQWLLWNQLPVTLDNIIGDASARRVF